ncbi:MAG: cobalamin B12-binding domain-containing protein [Pseudomonadota bacterium]
MTDRSSQSVDQIQSEPRSAMSEGLRSDGFNLVSAVQEQIIPHLLTGLREGRAETLGQAAYEDGQPELSYANEKNAASSSEQNISADAYSDAAIDEFASILLTYDAFAALRHAEGYVARGARVIDVLLDLCAPAARRVGDLWLNDACSFCDVTVATSSLEKVILRFGRLEEEAPVWSDPSRTILLGRAPGEQHLFGLLIVREMLRKAGWCVRMPAGNSAHALVDAVRQTRFTAIGLSVGNRDRLTNLAELIGDLRSESLNQNLLIMVGGQAVEHESPEVRALGADLIAKDGRDGLQQLDRMVSGHGPAHHVN